MYVCVLPIARILVLLHGGDDKTLTLLQLLQHTTIRKFKSLSDIDDCIYLQTLEYKERNEDDISHIYKWAMAYNLLINLHAIYM